MERHEISLEHSIDMGHRIVGHKGKCARLHGHTYKFQILADSMGLVEPGFVVDFGELKDVLNEWDHRTLLWDQDPLVFGRKAEAVRPVNAYFKEDESIVRVPFNPTAECIATYLANLMVHRFTLLSCQVTVWETPKASASHYAARSQAI